MESSFRKNLPWVTIALIAANGILFLAAECTGSTLDTDVLIRWGGAYTAYITEGQYWRLMDVAEYLNHRQAVPYLQERLRHYLDANVRP